MRVKDIAQVAYKLNTISGLDAAQRCFYTLIVIIAIGVLGLTPLPQKGKNKPWLFTSRPLSLHSHFSNIYNSTQQRKYALIDNNEDKDFSVEDSPLFSKLFAVAIGLLILSSINSQWWEIFFDKIKSFTYISFFSSLPLRSPPLFL